MRKVMMMVMAVAVGLMMTGASFAAEGKKAPAAAAASTVIKGKVPAVDAAKNTITLTEDKDGKSVVVTVPAATIADMKEGVHVKVTLKAGTTDQADTVKVLVHKKK